MLVISRKIGEEIKIGEDIIIKIIDIDKNQIRIGIDAPRDISILRGELLEEVKQQNILASHSHSENELKNISKKIKVRQ
jgi:carbon storage regulator